MKARAALAALVLLAAALAQAAPVVENGTEPAHGRRDLVLEELWRIGGLDDEVNLLGLISDAVAGADGNVYLMDVQLVQVLVYGPDGELVRTLGQEGDGPGEVRRPSEVVLLPDGTVGLVQRFPGRIVKLTRDGLPAGELHPGGDPTEGTMFSLMKVEVAGPHLAMAGAHIERDETRRTVRNTLAVYDATGVRQAVLATGVAQRELQSTRRVEDDGYFPRNWTLGPDGRVWIPPARNAYSIEVRLPDGTLERTVTREYTSYRRTDEELELVRFWMTPWRGRNRNRLTIEAAPTERDIMQMHVARDGRLWVLSSRGARPEREGINSVWDVFDPHGRFVEQVALVGEGRLRDDAIIFPGEGRVLVIKGMVSARMARRGQDTGAEEAAVPLEVICYRLPE